MLSLSYGKGNDYIIVLLQQDRHFNEGIFFSSDF